MTYKLARLFPLYAALLSCGAGAGPLVTSSTPPPSAPAEAPPAGSAEPTPPSFKTASIVLYQSDEVLKERLGGVEELAAFTTAIEHATAAQLPQNSSPGELDVVAIVRPGHRARFWFVDLPTGTLQVPAALVKSLSSIPVPTVQNGPVAIALIGSVNGAPTSATASSFSPPMPPEWRDAARRSSVPVVVPDSILATVWPD